MSCNVVSWSEATSEPPKSGPNPYCTFWRYNGMHFFDISTSKSGPTLVCFLHFDFEMCFAPQRRALFQHPNFQKWREHVVLCPFWLGNVLCATTTCTFSTSEPPKVAPTCGVLYILTSKCASRHNDVHFFNIRTSKKWRKHVVICTFWLGNVLRATTTCTFSTSEPPKVAQTCGDLYILTWKMCFAPQRRALLPHDNFQKWSVAEVFCTFWLGNVLRATTACTFSTSQLPKVVRQWCALYILTWKCASRHNGCALFDITTSKSGPNLVCFVHFDFEMCFAPQRRALFRHLNFQKWSENGVLCTFWLGNVLRATTACTFSSLIWPAGSAPAALASLLFDPPEPQIIGKTQCFATFLPFRASPSSFFLLFLSSTLLSSNLSLLSASSLLCFSSVHIVGSLTSKLPSIMGKSNLQPVTTSNNPFTLLLNPPKW